MHTAEHILNATMVRMFGCPRSRNAHIERKKSKCDYELPSCPTDEQVSAIESTVNEVISRNLDVTVEFMPRNEAAAIVDLSKLPAGVSETLRIVRVGDYDAGGITGAACLGVGIPLWIKGNRKLNAIADDYNQRYGRNAYGYKSSLSVGPTGNGIGLALNF